jgi:hypothetical protein
MVRRRSFGRPGARYAAAAAAAALLLAGCSGNSGGSGGGSAGGGAPGTVSAALSLLPSTSWDAGYLEFGQVTAVLGLNGGSLGTGPAQAYLGLGEGSIADAGAQASVLGFDPDKASAAVTVGLPPAQATAIYGSFDASAVGRKLTGAGFKQKGTAGGGTIYALAADNEINANNPTGDPQFNVVDVGSSRIVYGGSSANVDALAEFGGGTSLSSNSQVNALASCLGDAKAALIGQSSRSAGSPLVGIGLTGSSGSDAGEEICVQAKDSATASAIGAAFALKVRTGRSIRADEAWSSLLIDPQASVVSSSPAVVRLTAKPASGQEAGILLRTYIDAPTDLSALITP